MISQSKLVQKVNIKSVETVKTFGGGEGLKWTEYNNKGWLSMWFHLIWGKCNYSSEVLLSKVLHNMFDLQLVIAHGYLHGILAG